MKIISHGNWSLYKPGTRVEGAPAHAMFARRDSDLVDWYEYVNSGVNFAIDTLKLTAIYRDYAGGLLVGPVVTDPTMLFPPGCLVLEIEGYQGADPIAEFSDKVYDPETETFRSWSFPKSSSSVV